MDCSMPSSSILRYPWSLLKFMSIESVMLSNYLIFCHTSYSQFSLALGSFPMSQLTSGDQSIGTVASASVSLMTIQISFRIDWFDLLLVQGTLKSLLQHQNSKASVLQGSAFFMVQLSHLYMATGKTIVLTRQNFVGKVMSLLLNTLSRFVIAFLQGVSL